MIIIPILQMKKKNEAYSISVTYQWLLLKTSTGTKIWTLGISNSKLYWK